MAAKKKAAKKKAAPKRAAKKKAAPRRKSGPGGGARPAFLAWKPLGDTFTALYSDKGNLRTMRDQFVNLFGGDVHKYQFGVKTGTQEVKDPNTNEPIELKFQGQYQPGSLQNQFNADLLMVSDSAKLILNYVIGSNLMNPDDDSLAFMRFEFKQKGPPSEGGSGAYVGGGDDTKTDVVIHSEMAAGGTPRFVITFWCPPFKGG
jgi:hypothetical protein